MLRIIVVILLCVLLSVSAWGQIKVGQYRSFLDMNPSVSAIGMGEITAPSLDRNAFTINPGSLGLIHEDNHVRMSAYPVSTKWGDVNPITFRSYAVSGNVLNGLLSRHRPFSLNVGYHYNRLMLGIPITTYGNPEGTGEYVYIGDHAHSATVAIGVREYFDIGLGVTGTYLRESYEGFKADGVAFHFGLLVSVPPERFAFLWRENDDYRFILSPRFGVAWRNVGPDIKYQEKEYPLNDSKHWGGALDIGIQLNKTGGEILLFGMAPAFEVQQKTGLKDYKYGIETTVYDAITGRWGYIDYQGKAGYNTLGLSLSSRGLVCLVTDAFLKDAVADNKPVLTLLREKLNISFNFARKSTTISDDTIDFYSLSVTL